MIHALLPFCASSPQPRALDFLQKVMQAHADAAGKNMPASTTAALIQGQIGMPLESAVIAAINTTGGKHAPVTFTRNFWFYDLQALNHTEAGWKNTLRERVASGLIIPGFGHGLHKGRLAPELEDARKSLEAQFPLAAAFIADATEIVQATKPGLHPNIALYTALACELAELRHGVEPLVFILSRLPIWTMAWGNGLAHP